MLCPAIRQGQVRSDAALLALLSRLLEMYFNLSIGIYATLQAGLCDTSI